MASRAARIEGVARERFGFETLRPGQREAIEHAVAGGDVLAIMPTGYGKSAIYQIAGVILPGATVVVSPLIALQADQVASIEERADAPRAAAVNSSHSAAANKEAWRSVDTGDTEYLFVTAEQLADENALGRLREAKVGLFVVDEAHCVTSWGHDFRPDYLRLKNAIGAVGHPPVIALTASGSPPVRDDVVRSLGLREPLVLSRGFDRPNIRLEVVRHTDDAEKRRAVLDAIEHRGGSTLLYVATQRETTRYADALTERGFTAAAYHGAMPAGRRREVHERFHAGEVEVVVATSAFGMGIDRADVRAVVHADVPDSLDDYYHEAGRAGRDGEPALAQLHYREEDLGLREFFAGGGVDRKAVERVYRVLLGADGPIRIRRLAERAEVRQRSASRIVNTLERAGLARGTRTGIRARRRVEPAEAVEAAERGERERATIARSRVEMMRGYAETTRCRRQYLLGYFGERLDEPCGNCDTCGDGSAYRASDDDAAADHEAGDDEYRPEQRVRHTEWGEGTVMSTDGDRITVFFESRGYKVLSRELVEERGLLRAEPSGHEVPG